MADNDPLVQLRSKYDSVIRLMHQSGVKVQASEMKDGKFFIKGEAPSNEAKNKVWDQIKAVDARYADLTADISVSPTAATAPARTYTVKSGDTLSKIAKEFYGNANQYPKIFEANRDKLSDPDKIKVGQVLTIP